MRDGAERECRGRQVRFAVAAAIEAAIAEKVGDQCLGAAAQRLASATYLARQSVGRGQVILFAAPPSVRAGTEGTMRLLSNALVFGPGLGAEAPVIP